MSADILTLPVSKEKRQYARFTSGLGVKIGQHTVRLINWSQHGLALAVDQHTQDWRVGMTVTAQLEIVFDNIAHVFTVEADVRYRDKAQMGLLFKKLHPTHQRVLSNLADTMARQEPLTLDVLSPAAAAPPAPLNQRQRFWHVAGNLALVPATLVVLAVALYTVDWHVYRDVSPYAVIIAPTYAVQAPVAGTLVMLTSPDTARVSKGQPLARIISHRLEERLSQLAIQRDKQQSIVAAYGQQQERVEAFQAHYQKIAAAELSAIEEEARYLSRSEKRLLTLHKKGHIADSTLEKIRSEREKAKAQQQIAKQNEALAKQGFFYTGSRVEGGQNGQWQRDYALAQAEYDAFLAEEQNLKALQASYTLLSPCDCYLLARSLALQNAVVQGETLLTLYAADSDAQRVLALVQPQNLTDIQLGDTASLGLPDGQKATGRVTDLLPMGAPMPVPVNYRHLSAVMITPDAPLPAWHDVPVLAAIDRRYQNPVAFWRAKPDFAPRPQTALVLSAYPESGK